MVEIQIFLEKPLGQSVQPLVEVRWVDIATLLKFPFQLLPLPLNTGMWFPTSGALSWSPVSVKTCKFAIKL